jgi:IS4 transposase
MKPSTIAQLYQRRWQIEMLFKRLKQNNQLKYFLGDNQNAIETQIWCTLIADLITKIIQKQIKRPWSFANISSMLRIHLMSYTSLHSFLENPDKNNFNQQEYTQLNLFSSS